MAVDRSIADRHAVGIRVDHELFPGLDDSGPADEPLQQQDLVTVSATARPSHATASRSGSIVNRPQTTG